LSPLSFFLSVEYFACDIEFDQDEEEVISRYSFDHSFAIFMIVTDKVITPCGARADEKGCEMEKM